MLPPCRLVFLWLLLFSCGVVVGCIFFENYFLTTFEDYKNFDYITINIYLNKISLFKDFSEEYDKTNISKDNILKIMVANNEIEKIRTFLLKK